MDVNQHGILKEWETVPFGDPGKPWRGYACVCLGEAGGRWFWSTSYQLPNQGSGYSPGPAWHSGVSSRQEAERRGLAEIRGRLEKIVAEGWKSKTDRLPAQRILGEIAGKRQLSLF